MRNSAVEYRNGDSNNDYLTPCCHENDISGNEYAEIQEHQASDTAPSSYPESSSQMPSLPNPCKGESAAISVGSLPVRRRVRFPCGIAGVFGMLLICGLVFYFGVIVGKKIGGNQMLVSSKVAPGNESETVCGKMPEDQKTINGNDTKRNKCEVVAGPVGGSGGDAFSHEEASLHGNISDVTIFQGHHVSAIRIAYGGINTELQGNQKYAVWSMFLSLSTDEYITCVAGRSETPGSHNGSFYAIQSLRFTTNKNNSIGTDRYVVYSGSTRQFGFCGKQLMFIAGRSGSALDQLQFYFKC